MPRASWYSNVKRASNPRDPILILGGPITFSIHFPPLHSSMQCCLERLRKRSFQHFLRHSTVTTMDFCQEIQKLPGGFVPELDYPKLPEIAKATDSLLPARSHILTPHTELRNMFLIEGERGCHRSLYLLCHATIYKWWYATCYTR